MNAPKKILIVRTDRIGDVILSTPVIKNVRNFYPHAHIAFMCRPLTKEIVEGNPYLDEIISFDAKAKDKGLWTFLKFCAYLRKKKFDLAIILHPTKSVHWLTFFAGIPQRVGWRKKNGWLLTQAITHNKQEGQKHELEYTLDILRAMDIPIVDKNVNLTVKPEAEIKIKEILKNKGIKEGEDFIVIHPSASCPSKRWPQEYFSKLVALLTEKTGMKIVLITSAGEKEFGEKIVKESQVIDLRGELSISGLIALLKKAKLFISNDSGPVHLAWPLNIPVVSIFGRKDSGLSPKRWRPLSEKSAYIHKPPFDCQVCLAHKCIKGFLCLKAIKPEDLLETAMFLLKNGGKV
jgi:heptosyltransferase-2